MSYYDHAVSMHLKLGHWECDKTGARDPRHIVHHRRRSRGTAAGATMMVALVVGLLVLGLGGTGV